MLTDEIDLRTLTQSNCIERISKELASKRYGLSKGPSTKDNAHMRRKSEVTNKVNISCATKFVGKMDDFLSNYINKQAIIHLIANCLREKGCNLSLILQEMPM